MSRMALASVAVLLFVAGASALSPPNVVYANKVLALLVGDPTIDLKSTPMPSEANTQYYKITVTVPAGQPAAKASSLARLFAVYKGPTSSNSFNPAVVVQQNGQTVAPTNVNSATARAALFNDGFANSTFFSEAIAVPTPVATNGGFVVFNPVIAQYYNDDISSGSYANVAIQDLANDVLRIAQRFKFSVTIAECASSSVDGIHNCAPAS